MEKAKRFDVKSIVILSILILTLIITIVGICIPWIQQKAVLEDKTVIKDNVTINEYFTNNATKLDGFMTMFGLALVTVLLNAVLIVTYIVSRFVKSKKLISLWCACILIAIALLICSALTAVYTDSHIQIVYLSEKIKGYYCYLGAGAWLLTVFGIAGGIAGLTAFCELAFKNYSEKH